MTKFHEDWTTNVDFLSMANFWMWALFFTQTNTNKAENADFQSYAAGRGHITTLGNAEEC